MAHDNHNSFGTLQCDVSAITCSSEGIIKDLILSPKPGDQERELDVRTVIETFSYVTDGGMKWRILPHDYSNYNRD